MRNPGLVAMLALGALGVVAPAAAKPGLWRCELSPVTRNSAFYSGVLLIAYDSETGQAWVGDPGIGGSLEKGLVPATLSIKGGVIDMRWKVRVPVVEGPEVLRFGYKAGFDASGARISVRAWVDEGVIAKSGLDKVSGPCKRV